MIEKTLSAIAQESANIVLVGMPGCGKSTVGAELARLTGRRLVDTDVMVEERTGKSIPQIFADEGEAAFRALEREAVSEAGCKRGLIIACGGGVVLNADNRFAIRQNGRVYCLKRPLEWLERTGRPLSSDPERLRAMEIERRPFYEAAADLTVDNTAAPAAATAAILADFATLGD